MCVRPQSPGAAIRRPRTHARAKGADAPARRLWERKICLDR